MWLATMLSLNFSASVFQYEAMDNEMISGNGEDPNLIRYANPRVALLPLKEVQKIKIGS